MRECPRCERCFEDDVLLCPEDQTKTKATLPGTTLLNRRYRLDKRLGRGAMGQVYLARDENLITRRVAVKTVRPDVLTDEDLQEGEAIARFEREARTAASIQHPNVVDVTDFGKSDEGVFFLVMEYVEGESLYQLLRREGTISVQRALVMLRQICAGVEAAHDEGILHRDLKPANVFIVQRKKKDVQIAGDDIVKVGDFGLAKIISQSLADASGGGPASRGILGTPEYMAPEQMQSGVTLDARADIYALGAMAYHMLGGRPPFTGDIMQIFAQKLTQDTPALSTLRSDIPAPVEQAVMHALMKEADARPDSVAVWFNEFDAAAGGASVTEDEGESRLVIMAPTGAEVYVDDERHGSIGRSGRVILKSLPPGQHVLRVAHAGDQDDERVIEIRPDGDEQIIQAQFKSAPSSGLSPSQGGSLGSVSGMMLPAHTVVACTKCGSRFAGGAKFCGRCGNTSFQPVTSESAVHQRPQASPPASLPSLNSPSLNQASPISSRINCTRCGMEQPAGTKFCGRCGASLGGSAIAWNAPRPVEVLCPGCNSTYPAGTKFCGRCGRTI
jgi:serine/threonine protein kinase